MKLLIITALTLSVFNMKTYANVVSPLDVFIEELTEKEEENEKLRKEIIGYELTEKEKNEKLRKEIIGYEPTEKEMKNSNAGPYPKNYKKIVKDHISRSLKDPYSAKYRFSGKPYKTTFSLSSTPPPKSLEDVSFLYGVTVFINAKNGFGAYTGENRYNISIRDGVVLRCTNMTVWDFNC